MYHRFVAVAFALLFSNAPVAEAQKDSGLEALSFMEGCWRGPLGDDQGDFIEERYAPPTGNLMLGSVVYVRDGRATQHEFVELRSEDGAVSFLPYPGGNRSEHTFLMTSGDGTSAVFEAPEHDYPKRILYRAVGSDGLEGSIDGGPDDESPRRWPLLRVTCEAPADPARAHLETADAI